MDYLKKLGFLKGLAEGLEIDDSTKEGKVLLAVIDTLDAIVSAVEEMEDSIENLEDIADDLSDDIESLSDAIEDLESDFLSDDDDDLGGDIRLFNCHKHNDDEAESDYEIACPGCGHKIIVNSDMLDAGSVVCPGCEKTLEFEFRCDCGCGDDGDCSHGHSEE